MRCGCAGWQPSGTCDTPLISYVYLPVWETVAVGQKNERWSAYVCVCVFLLWIWHSYGKRHLWVSPFIPSLITIPTGKAAQRSLSNANSLSLLAHNRHRLAISHSPLQYTYPCIRLPGPNTLTHTHNVLVWLSPRETRQWTVNLLINTLIN